MVDVTYQMVLSTLQTAGILVGIAYYIMTLNYARKNQDISLRNQERTLETRHATIYNQLMVQLLSPVGVKNIQLLNDNSFSNIEEFSELSNSINEFNDAWVWLCNQFEVIGINIIEGVADIDFFARHSPWFTLKFWRQSKPMIYEQRKKYGPSFYRNMEYAMDSLEKYFEEHPELAP
ncbi:hypothetical protein E4H04_10710 [Candidatus Bathyarchaeota archaeon]|nr:MAG: hypothetical protein E4H04_10710 [Candidatus Bathyarchaeota archaeon]